MSESIKILTSYILNYLDNYENVATCFYFIRLLARYHYIQKIVLHIE